MKITVAGIYSDLAWGLYGPFVVRKLMKEYRFSEEQALANVRDRTFVAAGAIRSIMQQGVEIPQHIRTMVRRAKPETKIAAGIGAAVFGLGLIGLVFWLWNRNKHNS